jgi:hypothetical protein
MSDDDTKDKDEGKKAQEDANAAAERAFEAAAVGTAVPGSADEVDPELLKLPRRRRRRHPLIALAVIGLSIYLMWFVREDLVFFLRPRTPVDVGDASEALKQGRLQPNRFVTLAGSPDRKHALLVEARFGGFESLFRLLQTDNRVFVQQHRESRGSDESLTGSYTGQLRRWKSLPYHRALESYFQRTMTIAHDLDLAGLAAAKAAGGQARDLSGAAVRLAPDSQFWVNVAYPDEWLLQAKKQSYVSVKEADEKLLSGVEEPFAVDEEGSQSFWRFVIKADPEKVPALMARFSSPDLHANLVRRQVSYQARFDQLSVEGKTLVINAADPTAPARYVVDDVADAIPHYRLRAVRETPARVPADAILFISTSSPLKVPADAFVLLTGKRPSASWYYAVLYLLLLGFIVMNAATLIQRLREHKQQR